MESRVALRPVRVNAAAVMTNVLADPGLYEFTGGEPPMVEGLRQLCAIQTSGGPRDGSEE